jgi:imidazolonepropionase-like amidohydrolase
MLTWLKRVVLALGMLLMGVVLVVYLALRPPRFSIPEPARLEFLGVTIVNPGEPPLVGRRVLIEGGKIAEITEAADGPHRGKFLLPGLVDHHIHVSLLSDHAGLLLLRHGVTAIRDPGTPGQAVMEYRKAWRQGELAGPRLYACGLPLEGDPPTFGGALVVGTTTLARQRAMEQVAEGVDCLKVYNTLRLDALEEVTRVGKRLDVPVVGHVPVAVELGASGLSAVEHLTGLPAPYTELEARTEGLSGWLVRFSEADDARLRHFARVSAAQKIAHTPTLVLWHAMHDRRGSSEGAPKEHALMPSFVREVLWDDAALPTYYRLDDRGQAALATMLARTATVVQALERAGAPILAGTDAPTRVVPGHGLWRELSLLEEAGLSAEEALVAATVAPGARLAPGKLGRIQVGAFADLALFANNPAQNLSQLESIEEVVVAGRRYTRSELDLMVRSSLEHYDGWFVSRAWAFIARGVLRTMNAQVSAPAP